LQHQRQRNQTEEIKLRIGKNPGCRRAINRILEEMIRRCGEEEYESIDTIVMTWTLCSIPNAPKALAEMKRVLKPDGRLLFIEHGRAPEPNVVAWQDRLTPIWKRIGGGCRLNRKIDELIAAAGFQIGGLKTYYLLGPRPMTYTYQGFAEPMQRD
jgi:SAM-dependent methyltransferase